MKTRLRVIVVEDEALISVFIKTIVKDKGHDLVASCKSSQCALENIKELRPDVIFMDINILGALDGIRVVQQLNLDYKPSIFYITAYSDPDTIDEAMKTEPQNFIIKPIKEKDIHIALYLAQNKANYITYNLQTRVNLSNTTYYDYKQSELFKNNKIIKLTKLEKKLLEIFLLKENEIVNVKTLRAYLYDNADVADSNIRDIISRFRKKTECIKIETYFGKGYMFTRLNQK